MLSMWLLRRIYEAKQKKKIKRDLKDQWVGRARYRQSDSHRLTVRLWPERLGEHLLSLIFISFDDDANGKWFIRAQHKKRDRQMMWIFAEWNQRIIGRILVGVNSVLAGNYWKCFYSIFIRSLLTTDFLLSNCRMISRQPVSTHHRRTFWDNLNLRHF